MTAAGGMLTSFYTGSVPWLVDPATHSPITLLARTGPAPVARMDRTILTAMMSGQHLNRSSSRTAGEQLTIHADLCAHVPVPGSRGRATSTASLVIGALTGKPGDLAAWAHRDPVESLILASVSGMPIPLVDTLAPLGMSPEILTAEYDQDARKESYLRIAKTLGVHDVRHTMNHDMKGVLRSLREVPVVYAAMAALVPDTDGPPRHTSACLCASEVRGIRNPRFLTRLMPVLLAAYTGVSPDVVEMMAQEVL